MMQEYDEETLVLLQKTVSHLLAADDVLFETHDGKETTTHAYARFLQGVIDAARRAGP
jgi:hypothetical protein